MAGLGYKSFIPGTVLTAADINGYLMNQAVMRFDSDAARTSALGTAVSAGMVTYRADDAVVEVYDGSAWKAVGRDEPDQNFLINGNFDINQREGGSINLAPGYKVDRWAAISDAVNLTFNRFTSDAPAGSRYYVSVQDIITFPNGRHGIEQAIELDNVNRLWGKFVTFSILLRAHPDFNSRVRLSVQKNATANTRTGGTWSIINNTTIPAADVPKGTTASDWQRFSVTAFVPADGTANGLKVVAEMLDTTGLDRPLQFAQAQLEIGIAPSRFKLSQGTIQGELAACQRYYQRIVSTSTDDTIGVGQAYSSTQAYVVLNYLTTMRAAPSVVNSAVGGFRIFSSVGTSIIATAFSYQGIGLDNIRPTITVAGGLTAGNATALIGGTGTSIELNSEL